MKHSRLITVKELSESLFVPESTLYHLKGRGLIPFYKIGGSLRFSLGEVLEHFSGGVDFKDFEIDEALNERPSLKTEYQQQEDHLKDPFQ